MNNDEHEKELRRLYEVAITTGDLRLAAELIERIVNVKE